ncbi:MAG: heavy metal-binding domain-containing protein [Hyphomicrobiaceae bacterium]|nr:heavy metal-binding domain-containing protein [Hyphomicrobiaceae bacterium]
MILSTSDQADDRPIRRGNLLHANAISGANIIRDMREAVTNTIGGHMTRYESLLDKTIDRALQELTRRAEAQGYDGLVGVRIVHPTITTGAIAVVVFGTGFNFA